MDFVGNSYNGYLVTEQKMDGDTLLIKVDGVDGWFNCHDLFHGTCKTTQLKDFVAFSIILSEIEFLVRI